MGKIFSPLNATTFSFTLLALSGLVTVNIWSRYSGIKGHQYPTQYLEASFGLIDRRGSWEYMLVSPSGFIWYSRTHPDRYNYKILHFNVFIAKQRNEASVRTQKGSIRPLVKKHYRVAPGDTKMANVFINEYPFPLQNHTDCRGLERSR